MTPDPDKLYRASLLLAHHLTTSGLSPDAKIFLHVLESVRRKLGLGKAAQHLQLDALLLATPAPSRLDLGPLREAARAYKLLAPFQAPMSLVAQQLERAGLGPQKASSIAVFRSNATRGAISRSSGNYRRGPASAPPINPKTGKYFWQTRDAYHLNVGTEHINPGYWFFAVIWARTLYGEILDELDYPACPFTGVIVADLRPPRSGPDDRYLTYAAEFIRPHIKYARLGCKPNPLAPKITAPLSMPSPCVSDPRRMAPETDMVAWLIDEVGEEKAFNFLQAANLSADEQSLNPAGPVRHEPCERPELDLPLFAEPAQPALTPVPSEPTPIDYSYRPSARYTPPQPYSPPSEPARPGYLSSKPNPFASGSPASGSPSSGISLPSNDDSAS